MKVGDRVEFYDPLLQRRVTGTVYYRELSYETNQYNTYVRHDNDREGGVTAIYDGMNIVVIEDAKKSFNQLVKDALLRIKDTFGAVEI